MHSLVVKPALSPVLTGYFLQKAPIHRQRIRNKLQPALSPRCSLSALPDRTFHNMPGRALDQHEAPSLEQLHFIPSLRNPILSKNILSSNGVNKASLTTLSSPSIPLPHAECEPSPPPPPVPITISAAFTGFSSCHLYFGTRVVAQKRTP